MEHTQGSGTTNLYPADTRVVGHGLEVRESMVWRWGEGDLILGFLLKLFWGKCLARMTYHPKEAKMSWNH